MIHVTRLNGSGFAVNPDLLQRVEATPDTVLTLVDGTKYIVAEDVDEIVQRVVGYRASVVATAHAMDQARERATALHPSALQAAAFAATGPTGPDAGATLPTEDDAPLAPAVPLRRRRP